MGRRFTHEQINWVVENYSNYSTRQQVVDAFNDKFDETRGLASFEGIIKANCLRIGDKLSKEERNYIASLKGKSAMTIRELFLEKYGKELTWYDINRKDPPYRRLFPKEIRENGCVYCLDACTRTGKQCSSSANCYCKLKACPY